MAATVAAKPGAPSFFDLSGLPDDNYHQFVFRFHPSSCQNRATCITITQVCIAAAMALVLAPCLAFGKRSAPENVQPVIYNGVRYVAPNDDGRRGYIEAREIKTNSKLWDLTVFTNRIDPKLEEDVQWVFVKSLDLRHGKLVVTSERENTYQLDLNTKAVTQSDASRSATPDGAAQSNKLSETAEKAIVAGPLPKDYELSFQLNPSYLRGDFNGDGKLDVAVLVKQRTTGKLGIAIVHHGTTKVTILGAGTAIGNGGDDFEWMDTWQVYSKERSKQPSPHFRGDALLVSKSDVASALIYWNGKHYVWSQQGD